MSNISTQKANKQLQQQVDQTQLKINDKLRESLRMLHESKDIANSINVNLAGQSEKLRKIDGVLDETQSELKRAKKTIRSIESFWGSLRNKLFSGFAKKDKPAERLAEPTYQVQTGSQEQETNQGGSTFIPSTTGDALQNQYLDMILQSTRELKTSARNTNQQLTYQGKMIDRVTDKVDKNTRDMTALDKKMQKIINS